MKHDPRPAAPPAPTAHDDDHDARNAAIVAADDTGLLTSEIQLAAVELREGEVTPTE
jgi:hypothetical protein